MPHFFDWYKDSINSNNMQIFRQIFSNLPHPGFLCPAEPVNGNLPVPSVDLKTDEAVAEVPGGYGGRAAAAERVEDHAAAVLLDDLTQ